MTPEEKQKAAAKVALKIIRGAALGGVAHEPTKQALLRIDQKEQKRMMVEALDKIKALPHLAQKPKRRR